MFAGFELQIWAGGGGGGLQDTGGNVISAPKNTRNGEGPTPAVSAFPSSSGLRNRAVPPTSAQPLEGSAFLRVEVGHREAAPDGSGVYTFQEAARKVGHAPACM